MDHLHTSQVPLLRSNPASKLVFLLAGFYPLTSRNSHYTFPFPQKSRG